MKKNCNRLKPEYVYYALDSHLNLLELDIPGRLSLSQAFKRVLRFMRENDIDFCHLQLFVLLPCGNSKLLDTFQISLN